MMVEMFMRLAWVQYMHLSRVDGVRRNNIYIYPEAEGTAVVVGVTKTVGTGRAWKICKEVLCGRGSSSQLF